MPQFARQTAVPCTLAELQQGQWIQNPGLEPSGIRTSQRMISRCSILGVVIAKSDVTITVEDGTTALSVRTFDQKPIRAEVGDLVLVIGRPREYNGERYIVLEIVKRLRNPAWIQYRRKELAQLTEIAVDAVPVVRMTAEVEEATPSKNPFEAVIDRIRECDKGQGANIDDVLATIPDCQKFIQTLIEEGEIFEIKPGRLKVLE